MPILAVRQYLRDGIGQTIGDHGKLQIFRMYVCMCVDGHDVQPWSHIPSITMRESSSASVSSTWTGELNTYGFNHIVIDCSL